MAKFTIDRKLNNPQFVIYWKGGERDGELYRGLIRGRSALTTILNNAKRYAQPGTAFTVKEYRLEPVNEWDVGLTSEE